MCTTCSDDDFGGEKNEIEEEEEEKRPKANDDRIHFTNHCHHSPICVDTRV